MAASLRRMLNILQNFHSLRFHILNDANINRPLQRHYTIHSIHGRNSTQKLTRTLRTAYTHEQHHKFCYMMTVRLKSSEVQSAEGEPQLPSTSNTGSSVSDGLQTVAEPDFISLGLAKSTPTGFVQSVMESLHVDFCLPWWGSLVVGAVIIRTLMLPLAAIGLRGQIQVSDNLDRVQELEQRRAAADRVRDTPEYDRLTSELNNYKMKTKFDENKLRMLVAPLTQIPVLVTVILALRGMARVPVESLKTGGILWFTDLSIPDPLYILPVITSISLVMNFGLDSWLSKLPSSAVQKNSKKFWLGFSVCVLPLTSQFPSVLLFYWTASNIYTLFQVLFLNLPIIQKSFILPHSQAKQEVTPSYTDSSLDSLPDENLVQILQEKQHKIDEVNEKLSQRKSEEERKELTQGNSSEMDLTKIDDLRKR